MLYRQQCELLERGAGPPAPGPPARRASRRYVDRTPDQDGDENEEQYPMTPRTFVAGVSAVGVSRLRVRALIGRVTIRTILPSIRKRSPTRCWGSSPSTAGICARCASTADDGSRKTRSASTIARVLERARNCACFGCAIVLTSCLCQRRGGSRAHAHPRRLHRGTTTYSATPETFSAWIDAAPNLRHYGCTHGFCDGMGIGFLEAAAAATHLETLDLAEWGAQDDETTDAARLKRIMSALPPNLRIAPYGTYPGGPDVDNAIGDALRVAARAAGRMDLEILKFSTAQHAPRC